MICLHEPRFTRRTALAGLFALGGCASTGGPVPAAPFSLTAWAWGERVELLLINATDSPLSVASPFAGGPSAGLGVRVREAGGALLTTNAADDDNYVFPYADRAATAPSFRRLAPWKGIKGVLGTTDLVRRLRATGLTAPLGPDGVYDIDFRLAVQGQRADKSVYDARVRSRSLCVLRSEAGVFVTQCKSA